MSNDNSKEHTDSIFKIEQDNDDTSSFKEYLFKFRNGQEDVIAKGFLAVAQTFVAVGTGSGELNFVVPLDLITSVRELPPSQGIA